MVEAADLAQYLASAAQTGLEYLDGQYVDTANRARQENASLPAVPVPSARVAVQTHTTAVARGNSATAPLVSGLRAAGAAVQNGERDAA